ncbi:MAG: bacillithiol biosynthesis deacetylase BshB1 [Acidobacteriaceae bacterium]|nr:bacillithiol biosynthesis deacetylase BshB1 [Acidobacteriaceae bacterium]
MQDPNEPFDELAHNLWRPQPPKSRDSSLHGAADRDLCAFENLPPLDVLAIAAHPDDVEQTCGGTLIRMAERGYRSGVLDLTAGDMGTRGTPEIRIQESESAAQHLLLAWRDNLGWPDARFESSTGSRTMLAGVIRRLRPRVVILPYWTGRHPDHYRTAEIGYEACFLAGLKRLEEDVPPHRPFKVLYSSLYANLTPSFVVDITRQFDRRMSALFSYASQYGDSEEGSGVFPSHAEIEERLAAIARFYGNLIGVKYGEPFIVKEVIEIDDVVNMPVRSL